MVLQFTGSVFDIFWYRSGAFGIVSLAVPLNNSTLKVFSFLMSDDPSVPGELVFGAVPMDRYPSGIRCHVLWRSVDLPWNLQHILPFNSGSMELNPHNKTWPEFVTVQFYLISCIAFRVYVQQKLDHVVPALFKRAIDPRWLDVVKDVDTTGWNSCSNWFQLIGVSKIKNQTSPKTNVEVCLPAKASRLIASGRYPWTVFPLVALDWPDV